MAVGSQTETPVAKPIRKSIKVMARVAQTARFISLMPTPQDFATRICGDVIYMSALIQKFVDDINKMLDGYSNIPFDYLNNQLNSIVDSANDVLNRTTLYTESLVQETLGIAEDVCEMGSTIIDMTVDITSGTAAMASNYANTVMATSESLRGSQAAVGQAIRDGATGYMNSDNPEEKQNCLKQAASSIKDAENKAKGVIEDTMGAATNAVNTAGQWVQDLINQLKSLVDKMSSDVDSAFGGIVNSKFTEGLGTVADGLKGYDQPMVAQAVGAAAGAVQHIIQNFSLGKFVTAFMGVATNSLLITTGLNQLPPINFNKMLADFQGMKNEPPITIESKNDYQVSFDDLIEYDPEKYNKLKESFEELLQQERESIFSEKRKASLNKNKASEARMYDRLEQSQQRVEANNKTSEGVDKRVYLDLYNGMSKKERRELKTAINEIRKKREKAKRAKQSVKLKDVILKELEKIKNECKRFANRLQKEWEAMLKSYKDAIEQITNFFTNNGPGDQYVEDLCLDINENCENIKQLCTVDLPLQLTNSSLKAGMPYCFGMAVPNFLHNFVSFIVDLKIILKFIMDLLKYVMNIINDINKIARLLLNGINALANIIKQLMDLIGLGWLMSLVQSIIDLFNDVKNEGAKMFESTLQPVLLSQFDKYNEYVDEIYNFISVIEKDSSNTAGDKSDLAVRDGIGRVNGMIRMLGGKSLNMYEIDGNVYKFIHSSASNGAPRITTKTVNGEKIYDYKNSAIVAELKNQLEYIESIKDTYIVAYRSPRFKTDEKGIPDPTVVVDWVYYHPDLKHLGQDIEFTSITGSVGNYKNYSLSNLVKNKFGIDIDNLPNLIKRKYEDYFNSFLENAAKDPQKYKGWMYETMYKIENKTNKTFNAQPDPWQLFNIDTDAHIISAYELYYWFRGIDPNDWTKLIWPEDGELGEGTSVVSQNENGSVVRIDINGQSKLVWVKDKNLRQGDWVEVEGKYYRVY